MPLSRTVARAAVLVAGLAAVVVLPATSASAAADTLTIGTLPSTFEAGGSPGALTVRVTRRSRGCIRPRTAVAVRLPGLTPGLVRVQVNLNGQWRDLAASSVGDGVVATAAVPTRPEQLCRGKSGVTRYRLTFRAGTPPGRADVIVEAATGERRLTATRGVKVVGPTPSASATSMSPSASPSPSEPDAGRPSEQASAGVLVPSAAAATTSGGGGGWFGLGTLVMLLGLVMVGVGAALMVMLLRRNRGEGPGDAGGHGPYGGPGPGGPAGPYGGPDPSGAGRAPVAGTSGRSGRHRGPGLGGLRHRGPGPGGPPRDPAPTQVLPPVRD